MCVSIIGIGEACASRPCAAAIAIAPVRNERRPISAASMASPYCVQALCSGIVASSHLVPGDKHRLDTAGVADIVERIRGENQEISPLSFFNRSQIPRAQKLGAAFGGRGDDLVGSQPGLDHQLRLPVLETASET